MTTNRLKISPHGWESVSHAVPQHRRQSRPDCEDDAADNGNYCDNAMIEIKSGYGTEFSDTTMLKDHLTTSGRIAKHTEATEGTGVRNNFYNDRREEKRTELCWRSDVDNNLDNGRNKIHDRKDERRDRGLELCENLSMIARSADEVQEDDAARSHQPWHKFTECSEENNITVAQRVKNVHVEVTPQPDATPKANAEHPAGSFAEKRPRATTTT